MRDNLTNPFSPTRKLVAFLTTMMFVSVTIALIFFETEVVAVGTGVMVPKARTQVIQSEYDGRIKSINVQNGDKVQSGDVLLSLDDTLHQVNFSVAQRDMHQAQAELLYQNAQLQLFQSIKSQSVFTKIANQLKSSLRLKLPNDDFSHLVLQLNAKADLILGEQLKFESDIKAMQAEAFVLEQERHAINTQITYQTDRFNASKQLIQKEISSKSEHQRIKEQLDLLIQKRNSLGSKIDAAKLQELSYQEQEKSRILSEINHITSIISQLESRREILMEKLKGARRELAATKIRSPIDGTIDQLSVFTVGGIVSGAEQLMRVVPLNEELVLEANILNPDIGFVEIGQTANIKFDAYPFARFGHLKGRIQKISADSQLGVTGQRSFVVEVTLISEKFKNADDISISAGMTSRVEIITEKRRLITYFFAPIVEVIGNAMGGAMIYFETDGIQKLVGPLFNASKYHSNLNYNNYFRIEIKPYLLRGRFHLWLNEWNNPRALVTYANINDEILASITLDHKVSLSNADFDTGKNLYINDLFAPFDGSAIITELRENIFPDRVGHFVRRNPDTTIKRVSKIYGVRHQ